MVYKRGRNETVYEKAREKVNERVRGGELREGIFTRPTSGGWSEDTQVVG